MVLRRPEPRCHQRRPAAGTAEGRIQRTVPVPQVSDFRQAARQSEDNDLVKLCNGDARETHSS
jgi:hypothetical protein